MTTVTKEFRKHYANQVRGKSFKTLTIIGECNSWIKECFDHWGTVIITNVRILPTMPTGTNVEVVFEVEFEDNRTFHRFKLTEPELYKLLIS